ncbi:hypothetical protein Dip510_000345 [Elusimicrobium posterum]|uniref:lipoprotein N-acyltransferase Lnb domain-containing protein n=1 Tax=Elusimicrobium posterum TaxID=3116653 RepID=UPI003C766B96
MKKLLGVIAFSMLCAFCGVLSYAQSHADFYKQVAQEKQLYKNQQWLNLLHYKDGASEITSKTFFLSPKGQKNPQEEMNAQIDALFEAKAENEAFVCRFPLRAQWLVEQLGISQEILPSNSCTALIDFKTTLVADSAAVFYTGESVRNPENLFGHVGIVLNNHSDPDKSYALYFHQDIRQNDVLPLKFVKDILGMYKGYFVLASAQEMRDTFYDVNDRDVWEYDAKIDKAQLRTLALHMWELNGHQTSYSFIAYNSANAVDGILKTVKPDLDTDGLRMTPMDLVKRLIDGGFLSAKAYHPSDASQRSGRRPAAIPVAVSGSITRVPVQHSPVEAHDPTRIDAAFGYNTYRDSTFAKIVVNPLIHETIDSETGYAGTVHLTFFALESRYYFDDEDFDFNFTFAGLRSSPDASQALNPSINTSLTASTDKDSLDHSRGKSIAFTNNVGLTYEVLGFLEFSGFIKAQAKAKDSAKGWYLGTGAIGMVTAKYGDYGSTSANINFDIGTDGHRSDDLYVNVAHSFYINKSFSLNANYKYDFDDDKSIYDAGFSIYF